MKSNLFVINLFCILFVVHPAFAQQQNPSQEYAITKSLCSADGNIYNYTEQIWRSYDYTLMWKSAKNFVKMLSANDANALKQLYTNKGITDSTYAIINSPGYKQAVSECFPNDQQRQERFQYRFQVNDVLGEMLAAAGIYRMSVITYSGLKAVGLFAGLSERAIKIAFWSANAIGIVWGSAYQNYSEKKKAKEYKQINSSLNSLLQGDLPHIEQDIASDQNDLKNPNLEAKDRAAISNELTKLQSLYQQILAQNKS